MGWSIVGAVLAAAGIPSIISGSLILWLTRKIDRKDRELEKRENVRIKNETMLIRLTMASLSLGEATAEAVQRIPDAHCNGDMTAALDFAKKTKSDYRDFEHEQTAKTVIAS